MNTKNNNRIDMLTGSLPKNMLLFALPLAASSILQQLFNSADVAVVGSFAGKIALAAVSGTSSVINLFVNIILGLSIGVNVLIAHYVGQKKTEPVNKIVHTAISFSCICGIFLGTVGWFASRPILELIKTPANVINEATLYLRIYFLGMPFLFLYNFGSAILRSVGDTKRPLICLSISGIINVLLNLLFVILFGMGVEGVAIATVISNIVSTSMVLYILTNEEEMLRFSPKKLSFKFDYLGRVFRIGAPSAIQSAVFCLSNILIQKAINSFGEDAIGGSGAALNFEYITYFVVSAYSQTTVTFVSQNFGAGNKQRCRKVLKTSYIYGIFFTICMSLTFNLFARPLLSFFTSDPGVVKYALIRLRHVTLFEALTGSYEFTSAAIRGTGRSLTPAIITIFGSVVFRIIWLYTVFEKYHSFGMLMNVYIASWILTGTMMIITYYLITRKGGYYNA